MRALIKFAIVLSLLMSCLVYLAGRGIDSAQESNERIMQAIEEGTR